MNENKIHKHIQNCIDKLALNSSHSLLLIGCAKSDYKTDANVIQADFKTRSSIDDLSVDCIVCTGTSINQADVQAYISEFDRMLKSNGVLILEFKCSNSIRFLFRADFGKSVIRYGSLWIYSEQFLLKLAKFYGFKRIKGFTKIFQILSYNRILFLKKR